MREPDYSQAHRLVRRFLPELGGPGAAAAWRIVLGAFAARELAAAAAWWPGWAMPSQLPPPGNWRSWTRLGARGTGKTLGFSHFVNAEVEAGRIALIGIAAQSESKTIDVQVLGPSGLIATSPPWCRATWHASTHQVRWPNGAVAHALTPESPAGPRGHDFHLSWLSEVQSWPAATRDEAFSNFQLATRLGYARTVIDATPKRTPLLRQLLARAEAEPERHVLTTSTIFDNPYLGPGVIDDLVRDMGLDTLRGRQELLGEMVDDVDALFRDAWLQDRRPWPTRLTRRVLACDPAITSDPKSSDRSGIVDGGVDETGQLYVLQNLTAHHRPEELGRVLVDAYMAGQCDVLIVETNRGGNMTSALIRVAARERSAEVVVLRPRDQVPPRRDGAIFLREVNNYGRKVQRLEVGAALAERGSISFVEGGRGLDELVEQLLLIDPSEKGPNDAADAFAMVCEELADATRERAVNQLDGLAGATQRALGPSRQRRDEVTIERPNPLSQTLGSRAGGGGFRIPKRRLF